MCYTNIVQILDLSQIPILAKDRKGRDPFVIGGGPCVYNPEPLADFFDLFYIGEGETSYDALFTIYKEWKASGAERRDFLKKAANVPGIYVPSLYEVSYQKDDTKIFSGGRGDTGNDRKAGSDGIDGSFLSEKAVGSVHQGDAGPRRTGDPARLYSRLQVLPGGNDLPSHKRKRRFRIKAICLQYVKVYRTG